MNNNHMYYLSHYIYANLLCFDQKMFELLYFLLLLLLLLILYILLYSCCFSKQLHLNCSYENEWLWKVNRNNYANMLSMFLFVISTLMESGVIVDAIL